MIWESTFAMTTIDLGILGLVAFAAVFLFKSWHQLAPDREGLLYTSLLLFGFAIVGGFYLLDLATMWVTPRIRSASEAMAAMIELHLNWSWVVTLLAMGCLVIGFIGVIRSKIAVLERLDRELDVRDAAIAAREEVEAQLRHVQRLESIGTMAGGIAHEFNNLLTPVLGYADILAEEMGPNGPLWPEIEGIRSAALRGRDIVGQILSFSRREEGDVEQVDLRSAVEGGIELLRASLKGEVELITDLDRFSGTAEVDGTKIAQVVVNLCTNAAQALPNGKGTVKISLERLSHMPRQLGLEAGDYARLTVSDSGTGMSEEELAHVFDPFFTTKSGGTGMGLSVVHGIVTAYGGAVTAESELGEGSRVSVYLPLLEHESDRPQSSVDGAALEAEADLEALVVDDDEAVARMTARLLGKLGFDVDTESSSESALARLTGDGTLPDLLVTDQVMPGVSGLEIIRSVRDRGSAMPIVMISGHSPGLDPKELIELGVAFVRKPFGIDELETAVREARGLAAAL